MPAKYYNSLYEIEDVSRKKKFQQLLLLSLKNDLDKWTQTFVNLSGGIRTRYLSPNYNGVQFRIDCWTAYTTMMIAYISHKNPPISGHESELICDNNEFPNDLKVEVQNLRSKIYTSEIYDIEKLIGNQHSRKEKLDNLELEHVKGIVDDTYNDFVSNLNEVTAEMVAKIMYAYRRNEDIFNLWKDKFEDHQIIFDELKKLTG